MGISQSSLIDHYVAPKLSLECPTTSPELKGGMDSKMKQHVNELNALIVRSSEVSFIGMIESHKINYNLLSV